MMRLVVGLASFLLAASYVANGVKIDPALVPLIDQHAFAPRSTIADIYYSILVTFVEHEPKPKRAFVSRADQGMGVYSMLRKENQHAIRNLERELKGIGSWTPIREYAVSNSWLIKGTAEVIKYLASKQGVVAEIHWDRPFKAPQHMAKLVGQMEDRDVFFQKYDHQIKTKTLSRKMEEHKMIGDIIIEWNIRYVGASDVWGITTGTNMIYASADTGVEWTHPILAPRYVANLWHSQDDGVIKHDYAWWDGIRLENNLKSSSQLEGSINGAAYKKSSRPSLALATCPPSGREPCDDSGHGTHTTSTAVGKQNFRMISGVGGYGIAPDAYWMACRNMDNGVGSTSTYLNCLEFFLAPTDLEGKNPDPRKRPHVIGNSYGCPEETEACATWAFHNAISALREAGIVMVVSSGNTGPTCGSINSPPSYEPEVISVGATKYKSDEIASFSSRGPPPAYLQTRQWTHNIKPDVVAPGVAIRGAYKHASYMTLSGTSMAAPHVAGAVLLISAACPHLARNVVEIEMLITKTAKKLYVLSTEMLCGDECIGLYPNSVYGHGLLHVDSAVRNCIVLE